MEQGIEVTVTVEHAGLDPFRGYANAIRDELRDAVAVLVDSHVMPLGSTALDEAPSGGAGHCLLPNRPGEQWRADCREMRPPPAESTVGWAGISVGSRRISVGWANRA